MISPTLPFHWQRCHTRIYNRVVSALNVLRANHPWHLGAIWHVDFPREKGLDSNQSNGSAITGNGRASHQERGDIACEDCYLRIGSAAAWQSDVPHSKRLRKPHASIVNLTTEEGDLKCIQKDYLHREFDN